jgi:hypothetical protein
LWGALRGVLYGSVKQAARLKDLKLPVNIDFTPGAFGSMSSLPAISLDRALKIAAAFAASPSNPIKDRTMPNGDVVPKCFGGKQLADFLRSEEAGDMQVSRIPCNA